MGQQDGGSPAPDTRPDLQSTADRVALWDLCHRALRKRASETPPPQACGSLDEVALQCG